MSDDTTDKPYEVGFGKPPKGTQFRKGESSNPKGRPKGKPNLATIINRTLQAKVTINENGRRREVTKYEAGLIQLSNKAASGDLPALKVVIVQARMAEERMQQDVSKKPGFDEADQKGLKSLMERLQAKSEGDSESNDDEE
jgi:hypothetical protein